MHPDEAAWADRASRWLGGVRPRIGIILGSGLGPVADALGDVRQLDYAEVPGLPVSRVSGHAGKFLAGMLGGVPVLAACGRVHAYEGHQAVALGAHVRFLAACGIDTLITTNAAGSLTTTMQPGDWMLITDHLNLLGLSPLEGGPHFCDLTDAYDPALRAHFLDTAAGSGTLLHAGVYAAVRGPHYETPAEVRMLALLGADAVGMSTVPEVIQARALGMRVAALSCITNLAAGLSATPPNHDDVLAAGRAAATRFMTLLGEVLAGHLA